MNILNISISSLSMYASAAANSEFSPTPSVVILITFLTIFYLSGAFIAATIAEVRYHNRLLHFLGALILPVFYPVLIFLLLPPKRLTLKDNTDDLSIDPASLDEAAYHLHTDQEVSEDNIDAQSDEDEEYEGEEEGEAITVINQQYFAAIAVDEEGNHLGPFIIELNDGTFLEAEKIINPLPDVVILEIVGENKNRTLRVPYAKISTCCFKSDWLEQS